MLDGTHSTHRSIPNPCCAAALLAEENDFSICLRWRPVTIGMKYFACQIVTCPARSPTRTSMPQSPGFAAIMRVSGEVAARSWASMFSNSARAPASFPARSWCATKLIGGSPDAIQATGATSPPPSLLHLARAIRRLVTAVASISEATMHHNSGAAPCQRPSVRRRQLVAFTRRARSRRALRVT